MNDAEYFAMLEEMDRETDYYTELARHEEMIKRAKKKPVEIEFFEYESEVDIPYLRGREETLKDVLKLLGKEEKR